MYIIIYYNYTLKNVDEHIKLLNLCTNKYININNSYYKMN